MMIKKSLVLLLILILTGTVAAESEYCNFFYDTPVEVDGSDVCSKRASSFMAETSMSLDTDFAGKGYACAGVYKGVILGYKTGGDGEGTYHSLYYLNPDNTNLVNFEDEKQYLPYCVNEVMNHLADWEIVGDVNYFKTNNLNAVKRCIDDAIANYPEDKFLLTYLPECDAAPQSEGGQTTAETVCSDRIDDDNDGKIDCLDEDCYGKAGQKGLICCKSGISPEEDNKACITDKAICDTEGITGSYQCYQCLTGEWDCEFTGNKGMACQEGKCVDSSLVTTETICNNNIDDDTDGTTDCLDQDCAQSAECTPPTNLQPPLAKSSGDYNEDGKVDNNDISSIKGNIIGFWNYLKSNPFQLPLNNLNDYLKSLNSNWGKENGPN
jgi:hypothetical protein